MNKIIMLPGMTLHSDDLNSELQKRIKIPKQKTRLMERLSNLQWEKNDKRVV